MINSHKVYIIAAVDEKCGIGKGGALPWRFKKETQYFLQVTSQTADPRKQNMVVMGRTTWESLPAQFRPLSKRLNVVLTRDRNYVAAGAVIADSLDTALAFAGEDIKNIFIIGGGQVYKEAITQSAADGIYLTRIKKDYACDTFFSAIPAEFDRLEQLGSEEENGVKFDYFLYQKSGVNSYPL